MPLRVSEHEFAPVRPRSNRTVADMTCASPRSARSCSLTRPMRGRTAWVAYKQSGWGREMGHEVLEAYTEVKTVTTLL